MGRVSTNFSASSTLWGPEPSKGFSILGAAFAFAAASDLAAFSTGFFGIVLVLVALTMRGYLSDV
jgi:hypothetical protein